MQRKNSIEQLANNLKLLYGRKNSDTIEAGLTDLETALKIIDNKNVEINNNIEEVEEVETNKSKLIIHQYAAFVKDSKIFFGNVIDITESEVKSVRASCREHDQSAHLPGE